MKKSSHSTWCKCQKGLNQQHAYPSHELTSYAEMQDYAASIGHEIKTFDEMCSWAHYSPSVARGGRFSPFKCSCCGYSPTELEWRADLAKFNGATDEEQAALMDAHNETGVSREDREWQAHLQQYLFMPPGVHHGMDRAGVDSLHLIYLNLFKLHFSYMCHDPMPEGKKKLVKDYIKKAGFYSYDAAADDKAESPVIRWIGREVKRFLAEAHEHLPFLLRIAACPPEVLDEAMGSTAGERRPAYPCQSRCPLNICALAGEVEEDDELGVTDDEIAAEAAEEADMMTHASYWDDFLALVADSQKPWAEGADDTDAYRKGRALTAFNLGAPPPSVNGLTSILTTHSRRNV